MDGERSQSLLMISDFIRNGNLSEETEFFGAEFQLEELNKDLPRFIERLNREGLQVQVRITSLDYESIFVFGNKRGDFVQSVSFPIVYVSDGDRVPARLSISIGGASSWRREV